MRINYGGQKKRREEAHRKKQEEKRLRRLNKSKGNENAPEEPPYDPFQVDPPPQA